MQFPKENFTKDRFSLLVNSYCFALLDFGEFFCCSWIFLTFLSISDLFVIFSLVTYFILGGHIKTFVNGYSLLNNSGVVKGWLARMIFYLLQLRLWILPPPKNQFQIRLLFRSHLKQCSFDFVVLIFIMFCSILYIFCFIHDFLSTFSSFIIFFFIPKASFTTAVVMVGRNSLLPDLCCFSYF